MFIWGRLLGVFFGIGWGLLGAILGYILGHFFDKGLKENLSIHRRTDHIELAFFITTFNVLGHLAKADGAVSEEEIQVAEKIMHELQLDEQQKLLAKNLFNQGKQKDFDLDAALEHLLIECSGQTNLLRFFIEIQINSALADGVLASEEKRILLFICNKLNFSPNEFERLYRAEKGGQHFHGQQKQTIESAFMVLGVHPDDSNKDIKKAYRRLIARHHPDKLAAKGLPKEMMALAKEKTQEITAAYELICHKRGFR